VARPAPIAALVVDGQGYEPLGSRRRAVAVVFGVLIAVDFLAIGSSLLELDLLGRVEAGEPVTTAEIDRNDDRQTALGAIQFALLIAAAVVFIRWLRAAYRNVDRLAPGLRRHGHGWAIGAWFVPFLNLWRPKQLVNDVWRAGGTRGAAEPLPVWLNLWWAGWLAVGILWNLAGRRAGEQETIEQIRTGDWLYIASDSLDAVVAAVAILVVWRLTDRLDGRGASPAPAGEPPAPASTSWPDDPNALTSVPPPGVGGWAPPTPERA
jgi:uncharacterized protein DUF4328